MKKTSKQIIFITLSLFSLVFSLGSLMIYTSLFKGVPWYESCGLQFLGIFLWSDPGFLILGIALFILGRFIRISLFNRVLPLIAIVCLSLPILIDESLSRITLLIGAAIGIIIFVATIVSTVKNLIYQNKNLMK